MKAIWRPLDQAGDVKADVAFMANLKNLQQATIWWAKEKKLAEEAELGDIERWVAESFLGDGDGFESEEKKHILLLKEKRMKISLSPRFLHELQ
jgi:hypothetical protein